MFVALSLGTAWAASLPRNSVGAKQIKADAVRSSEAADNALTGQDVNEATLGEVPSARSAVRAESAGSAQTAASTESATRAQNADLLDELNSTDFLRSNGKAADADLLDGSNSSEFAPTSKFEHVAVQIDFPSIAAETCVETFLHTSSVDFDPDPVFVSPSLGFPPGLVASASQIVEGSFGGPAATTELMVCNITAGPIDPLQATFELLRVKVD